MKKLDPRIYRIRKLMDFTGVILLALLLLFIWQLYRGPIAVPFLKPYIIKALNHDDSQYQVTLDEVNIELVRSIKPIKIIATNVDYKKNDGNFTITAPKTSVSFSIKALLRGVIAPSSINVMNPSVYIFTDYGVEKNKANEVNQKKLEYYFDAFENFIERFNSEDKSYPESYINDISIENAEVEFHEVDLGRKWAFSDLNYKFERNFLNIETEFNALLKSDDKLASLGFDAEYRPLKNKLALQFYFSDIVPKDFMAGILGEDAAKEMYGINVPLSGRIEGLVDFAEVLKHKDNIIDSLDTAIEKIKFSFEGGSGNIMFSEDESQKFDISGLLIEGELTGGLDKLKIENASFDLGAQKAKFSVYVNGVKDYFLRKSLDKLTVKINAGTAAMHFDDLYKYWPRYLGTIAWDWCKDSISGGNIYNADFTFNFGYDAKTKKFAFRNLSGSGDLSDVNLEYLEGMPLVTNIYGKAHFTNDTIKIDVDKAVSDNVVVEGGFVRLYDLDKYDNFAEINLQLNSSISDALKLIDHKPLNYASEMGIKPDSIQGMSDTKLIIDLELKRDLAPDEVKVDVKSKLYDVLLPDMIDKKSVEAKELDLEVTNAGLKIIGEAKLEGIPLNLVWNENFADKTYNSRYNISFKFDDAVKKKLNIDSEVLNPPFIDGYVLVDAVITSFADNKMQIDINGNLANASVDYSFLGFKKPLKQPGVVRVRLNFLNNKLQSIPSFSLNKHDFKLNGKIDLDKEQRIKLVDIFDIKAPKTNAKAKIEMVYAPKKKVKINVSGSSYDLSPFFDKDENTALNKSKKQNKTAKGSRKDDEDELEQVDDTDIFIAVNSLWTNDYVSVKNFAGSAKLRHGIGIQEMHLIGNFGTTQKKYLKLDYTPRPGKEYLLNVESNDAGGTMKFLRVYDNMRGGTLNISGKREKNKTFIGHAKIRDFSIHNTPILAKLLSLASLTGMVNLLTGEGIAFSHFDAPFEYQDKILRVNDGRAFGNVMGITVKGQYDRHEEALNVDGVIAPAYGLNTFIGKLPIVGNLLSSKDGTVFAANYSITGDISDPNIRINPLSALSPGSLKDLWSSIFGSSDK